MSKHATAAPGAGKAPVWRPNPTFLAGAVLIAVTAVLIVVAVGNVIFVLARSPQDTVYLLSDAPPPDPDAPMQAPIDTYTLHVSVQALDEAKGLVTLYVYGIRTCPTTCPAAGIYLLALGGPAAERLGLPPIETVVVAPNTQEVSGTVQLPVHTEPMLYPFDKLELVLGVLVQQARPDGTMAPITLVRGGPATYLTLRSQLQGLNMAEPVPVEPASVRASIAPSALLYVRALNFRRLLYLPVLTVLVVGLLGAAAMYSVRTLPVRELIPGLSGLILGVWGSRWMLTAGGPPYVTTVDLLLAGVILILLAGLLVRVTFEYGKRRVDGPAGEVSPKISRRSLTAQHRRHGAATGASYAVAPAGATAHQRGPRAPLPGRRLANRRAARAKRKNVGDTSEGESARAHS